MVFPSCLYRIKAFSFIIPIFLLKINTYTKKMKDFGRKSFTFS